MQRTEERSRKKQERERETEKKGSDAGVDLERAGRRSSRPVREVPQEVRSHRAYEPSSDKGKTQPKRVRNKKREGGKKKERGE